LSWALHLIGAPRSEGAVRASFLPHVTESGVGVSIHQSAQRMAC